MKLDLHIHSKYSKDSLLKPETILKIAKKRRLSGIAVTDHNTIKGGLVTQKINNDENFTVIVGSEIKTEYGDVIGLFLQEEIISQKFEEVVDEIKSQDGLLILAHPFRKNITYPASIFKKIDLIEAFNARSPKRINEKSLNLAKTYKKPTTAGSDAHLFFEIGRAQMELNSNIVINSNLKDELIENSSKVKDLPSNYYLVHGLSFSIENIKRVCKIAKIYL